MPVEIRELVIKTVINDSPAPASNPASSSTGSSNDAVIAACVEQVMEILKQKNER